MIEIDGISKRAFLRPTIFNCSASQGEQEQGNEYGRSTSAVSSSDSPLNHTLDYIIEVIALPSTLSDSFKDSTPPSTFLDLGKNKNYLSAQYILKKGFSSWAHDNT